MAEETIKVLLVEDNAEHAQLLKRLLLESDDPVFEVAQYAALRPALDALDDGTLAAALRACHAPFILAACCKSTKTS